MQHISMNSLNVHNFPDGMSFRVLPELNDPQGIYVIDASIRSATDLLHLSQLVRVIERRDGLVTTLRLHYLLGSRMDRQMDDASPDTLRCVCDIINNLAIPHVEVVFPHSQSTMDILDAHPVNDAEAGFIADAYRAFVMETGSDARESDGELGSAIVLPDAGAAKRFWNEHAPYLRESLGTNLSVVECSKHRDMATGKLSGFSCPSSVPDRCLIVDDLCDGGGTFVGLAKKLREAGAKSIGLCVYHGIFSKPLKTLDDLDFILSSTSYSGQVTKGPFAERVHFVPMLESKVSL